MFSHFRQQYIVNFWDTGKSMIALGVISAVFFGIFGAVWAITGEITRWGGEFLELFGADLSSYSYYQRQNLDGTIVSRRDGLMLIGMFFGCFIAALLANKVKFRLPASKIRVFQAIVGGILSGFGARLAFGCNLANFFTGIPYFSLHTWVFTLFMIIGIYAAIKVCNIKIFKPQAKLIKAQNENGKGILYDKNRVKRHTIYGIATFLLFCFFVTYLIYQNPPLDIKNKKSLLPLAPIFGFVFGFIISKGQVCFTSCFRDLFLFGRDIATKGAIFGMIIASLIAFAFILHGNIPKILEISPAIAVGAFLFGFGIVFAGGCECGWTYRAFEGQIHFLIVGIANIAGTMLLALNYDILPKSFASGVKINLLEEFGKFGGFFVNLSLLLIMLGLVLIYKYKFFNRLQK